MTVCTHNKRCWFGEIIDGEMCLNDFGKIVLRQWEWLQNQYPYVELDEFVIMPNHFHGVLVIVGNGRDRSLQKIKSLSELMGAFKTTSSKLIHGLGLLDFRWQKSFYDHVIRSERTLENIRAYIQNNPLRWNRDWENKPPSFQDKAGLKKYYDDILNGT